MLTSCMDPADHYHAITQEMKLSEDGASYTMIDNCTVDFELAHANKGFEGIQYHEQDGGAPIEPQLLQFSDHRAWLHPYRHLR
jgi:hypothetical protein